MLRTGWYLADPLLSAGISLLILWGAWRLLAEAVDVLLEAAPPGLDGERVRAALTGVDGVADIHDLHVWTVTSGFVALSAHLEVTDEREWQPTLLACTVLLRDRFGIAHATLQPERASSANADPFTGCTLDTPEGRAACLTALPGHRH
jgi:cobalt-zinc-cadmium efflux system protein